MDVEVAMAGSGGEAIAAPVIVLLPVGPREIRPLGIRKPSFSTTFSVNDSP
ncbi:MAG: hypothetical protein O7B35_08505 [Deltaproteobacteria bacterium]|nr:hypothetical protein [Deltaproteobacteria bacterium]